MLNKEVICFGHEQSDNSQPLNRIDNIPVSSQANINCFKCNSTIAIVNLPPSLAFGPVPVIHINE